jgi:hypothetical protein
MVGGWATESGVNGYWINSEFLPANGSLFLRDGTYLGPPAYNEGHYWSSTTISAANGSCLYIFVNQQLGGNPENQAQGNNIRCVKQ